MSEPISANPLNTRGVLLAVCAAVWAVIVLLYAQAAWLSIVMLLLTDGLLALLLVLAAAGLGDVLVRPVKWTTIGPLRFATAAGVGLGAFSLTTLGLGLAGLLSQIIAIAMPVVSLALWWALIGRKRIDLKGDVSGHLRDWLRQPAGWRWLFVAAMPALAIATVGASIMPGLLWKPDDPHAYDVVSYHLQVPREWYELGRIVPLTHNAFSYFPFNVEMQFLLSMHLRGGPWAGMYLAQFMSLAFGVLAVVATYGAARVIATKAGATLAAVALATIPWTPMLSSVAFVESGLMSYVALAVGWVILPLVSSISPRSFVGQTFLSVSPPGFSSLETTGGERGERQAGMPVLQGAKAERKAGVWQPAAIAGMCAGLACGVKLTAGPMLILALPAVYVVLIARQQQWRAAIVGTLVYGAVAMVVLSPWLIRNVMWVGNPVFPNLTNVLGAGHFLPGQVERFTAAHAPGGQSPLAATVWQLLLQWQFGYVLVPLALVGVFLARKRPAAIALLAVALVHYVLWAGPTHRIGRFMVPAAPVFALLVGQLDARRAVRVAAACLIVVAAIIGWFWDPSGGGGMNGRLERFAATGRQGLFGLEDVSFVQPVELQQLYDAGGVVHFVGDAQTFLHKAKTSQLRYRTIFDVRSDTNDPVEAWTGKPLRKLPAGEWVLIDPAEIARLSKTYRHVPDVPASYPGPRDRPYLMNNQGQVVVPVR